MIIDVKITCNYFPIKRIMVSDIFKLYGFLLLNKWELLSNSPLLHAQEEWDIYDEDEEEEEVLRYRRHSGGEVERIGTNADIIDY